MFQNGENTLDRRTAYTKMVIKEAFLKFLNIKPLEQITIKEICMEANINRATFYRNYKDIYDLFEEIEMELMQEAFPNGTDAYEIPRLLEVIHKNQIFYKEFFRTHLQSSVIKNMTDEMQITFANTLKENGVYNEETYNYYFQFAMHGATGLLKEWFDNDCTPPPKEFSVLLLKMCYKLFDL